MQGEVLTLLALFGGLAAAATTLVKSNVARRLSRRLEIKLPSGERVEISADARVSAAELNDVVSAVLSSVSAHDSKALARIAERESVLGRAYDAYSRPGAPNSTGAQGILQNLRELLDENPLDGRAAMVLARAVIHTDGGTLGLKEAIRVLSSLISRKTEAGRLDDGYADALYNRACYRVALMGALQDSDANDAVGHQRNELRKAAIADLKESLRVAPGNLLLARVDTDFSRIRDDLEFQSLLGDGPPGTRPLAPSA